MGKTPLGLEPWLFPLQGYWCRYRHWHRWERRCITNTPCTSGILPNIERSVQGEKKQKNMQPVSITYRRTYPRTVACKVRETVCSIHGTFPTNSRPHTDLYTTKAACTFSFVHSSFEAEWRWARPHVIFTNYRESWSKGTRFMRERSCWCCHQGNGPYTAAASVPHSPRAWPRCNDWASSANRWSSFSLCGGALRSGT